MCPNEFGSRRHRGPQSWTKREIREGTSMKLFRLMSVTLVVLGALASDAAGQSAAARATPPSTIPTVSLTNVARHGFWYAGGKYVGELGEEKESTMGGAIY